MRTVSHLSSGNPKELPGEKHSSQQRATTGLSALKRLAKLKNKPREDGHTEALSDAFLLYAQ